MARHRYPYGPRQPGTEKSSIFITLHQRVATPCWNGQFFFFCFPLHCSFRLSHFPHILFFEIIMARCSPRAKVISSWLMNYTNLPPVEIISRDESLCIMSWNLHELIIYQRSLMLRIRLIGMEGWYELYQKVNSNDHTMELLKSTLVLTRWLMMAAGSCKIVKGSPYPAYSYIVQFFLASMSM